MIALSDGQFGSYVVLNDDDTKSVLVQNDWDFPGLAHTFGWSVSSVEVPSGCEHSFTDGTIDCVTCGLKASVFIEAADTFLSENVGKVVEDPGYFTED
jgi:hypothetical protein